MKLQTPTPNEKFGPVIQHYVLSLKCLKTQPVSVKRFGLTYEFFKNYGYS
jgi:hypothetical protein